MQSVAADTREAATELTQASEYQRKAGRRAACLMIVLVIVVAIVLLAVRGCLRRLLTPDKRDADPELDTFIGCVVSPGDMDSSFTPVMTLVSFYALQYTCRSCWHLPPKDIAPEVL